MVRTERKFLTNFAPLAGSRNSSAEHAWYLRHACLFGWRHGYTKHWKTDFALPHSLIGGDAEMGKTSCTFFRPIINSGSKHMCRLHFLSYSQYPPQSFLIFLLTPADVSRNETKSFQLANIFFFNPSLLLRACVPTAFPELQSISASEFLDFSFDKCGCFKK